MKESIIVSGPATTRKPVWPDIAMHFPDSRECLAAFLAFESAEILEGVKPASLVNLVNRERCCGKNFYLLWKEFGKRILSKSSLHGLVLTDRGDSLLLILYSRPALELLLESRGVASVLKKAGYPAPFSEALVLRELQNRMYRGRFPHEIGTLLGYPLKDVAGFLGWGKLECTGTSPWKIFGDPRASLDLAAAFRHSRFAMAARLLAELKPSECLRICKGKSFPAGHGVFLSPVTENENQYYMEAV